MKWFKHMSTMSNDPKVRRLIRRFGVEGYGVYNYILELIVRRLESDSPIPDLEETASDIAADLDMDTIKVEEIVLFSAQQGLFEHDAVSGRLVAHKIYKFLDSSTTRNMELKKMISSYKEQLEMSNSSTDVRDSPELSETVRDCPGQSGTNPDSPGLSVPEKKRREENRRDNTLATADASAPAGGLSPLKDGLANQYQDAFTSETPASAWANIGLERKKLNEIASRTRRLSSDTGIDPEDLAPKILEKFNTLRRTERASFWKTASFTPSSLAESNRWGAVVDALKREYAEPMEVIF